MKILDCTLRDGGYCNQWKFGYENTKKIVAGLCESGIDIIECGFLTEKIKHDLESTQFNTIEEITNIISESEREPQFVCMINYGEYDVEKLPDCNKNGITGIRIAFHKRNMKEALIAGHIIKEKGYRLYLQPMVSLNYSDEEFLLLIQRSNELKPYAFYIVDSFGVMKQQDLIRLFYLVEHNLKKDIAIGFHSHNNMQLAYSNAQALLGISSKHEIIIDSSIFGMGRGAGNLNTELFLEYLNDNYKTKYRLKPLLIIIDEILNQFYQKNYWGYSLPNYLSAKYNTHPSYAIFLDAKKTLTIESMDEIFSMMENEKRSSYEQQYIERLYEKYMSVRDCSQNHLNELIRIVSDQNIVIIAPGKSSIAEKDKILECVKCENAVAISINHKYEEYECDYIFVSNLRRYRELNKEDYGKCIITTNIRSDKTYLRVNYEELINNIEAVSDNASMMLIKLLILLGARKVFICGLDGYSVVPTENFADEKMNFYVNKTRFEEMNEGLNRMIERYSKEVPMEFVTTPVFVHLNTEARDA